MIISICIAALCGSAFAQTKQTQPVVTSIPAGINPALIGINTIHTVIMPYDAELRRYFAFWENLKLNVEQKLESFNIRRPAFARTVYSARTTRFPELLVEVPLFRIYRSSALIFRVQTSFVTNIGYGAVRSQTTRTKVWISGTTIAVPSQDLLAAMVNSKVLEQVDQFIREWLAANPQTQIQPEAKTSEDSSRASPEGKTGPEAKSPATESRYVASVKARVFHKPDCRFAGRIKPENLVTYESREDAIKDGKKPCRICKP